MKKPVSKNAASSLGRSSLGLGAIQRETLNDRVYQQLRTMIMSGAVSPGKELKLRELAKELHVSLMPVRDAIGRLVVESEAGALAAGHATSGLVDSLNLLQKKIAAPTLSKQQEFFALNREFHFAIYQAAQSPLLFSMIEQLWLQIGPVFSHTSMDYVSGGADAHEKIIAALVARDADATRAAIAEDLTKGGERFAAALAGAQ
jgi:DNA-binding GntR family transcriptional regulator